MASETSNRGGLLTVCACTAFIAVTTPVVARMLGTAWDDRGPAYELVHAATGAAGVNIDLGVVVPAGFFLVLLALFALDEFKRLQAGVLVVGGVLFVLTLSRMGKWVETVDWARYWWGLVPGGLVGLVGLYGAKLPSRGRREFPAAARWIYGVTAAVVVAGLLEYHLAFRSGLGVQFRDAYLTIPASVLLLIAVAEFVKYSNRRDIVIIGGNDVAEAEFVGGLFAEARDRFDGVPLDADGDGTGAVFLNKAAAATDRSSLPTRGAETAPVAFKFAPGGPLSRQVVVSANRYEPPTERDVDALRERVASTESAPSRVGRFLRRRLAVLLPRAVRRAASSRSNRMTERLRTADTILLVAPMSDFVEEDLLESGDFEDWRSLLTDRRPRYATVYRDLCELYSRSDRRAVVVATEANLAMRVYEEKETSYPSFRDAAFTSFVANTVLTGDELDATRNVCEVVPVDRNYDEDGEGPDNFDHLLFEISQ